MIMGLDSYRPSVLFCFFPLRYIEVLVAEEHCRRMNKCSVQSRSCQRCSNQCCVMRPDTGYLGNSYISSPVSIQIAEWIWISVSM